MKAYTKKILSSVIAIATLINSAALASAYAAEEPVNLGMIFVESEAPGEYGYIAEKYVDENGNEVELYKEDQSLFCQSLEGTPLPESYDAREDGYVTPARNQSTTNNCWVFSTINTLESDSIAKGYTQAENTDFSEAHLAWYACKPNTLGASDGADGDGYNYSSPYKQGGNWRMATAALSRRSGIANEEAFPFGSISSMGNYDESDRFNTSAGVMLESAQELTDENEIKSWIQKHGSVSAALYYNDGYFSSSDSAYYCNTEIKTNHQITVIGWDDSYPASKFTKTGNTPASDGAWICQNSWGSDWGDNGCFAISYYDATLTGFVGFSVTSADRLYNNYTHNGDTWNVSVYANIAEMATANIFVADGYEKLTSVSTYTVLPDTYVKVKIFKNLPENYSKPSDGTLVATIEQSIDNSGYHTLYPDEKIDLEPGEIFSIAVYYYHHSGNVKVPLERTSSKVSYHSDARESYILFSASSNNWKETSANNFCNAMIQATTECAHPHKESTVTAEATCDAEGTLSEICTQCNKTTGTKCITRTEHSYGEWSEYTHDDETNVEICYRECSECGDIQNRSYTANNSGSNTVSLSDFLSIFFEKFLEIFRFF